MATDTPTLIIYMKQGDTAPLAGVQLIDANAAPVNLTGATVKFNVKKASTIVVDHLPMIVDDALTGRIHFDAWASVDAAVFAAMHGDHLCEYEVTFANGQTLTFPNGPRDATTTADADVTLRITKQVA